jgi:SAM-dependent methyltransferase
MSLTRLITRLIYSERVRTEFTETEDEIEGWVAAAGLDYFSSLDEDFVNRAIDLGVSSGMVLDVNSRLGLVTMKLLWKKDDLLAIGAYRTKEMADRTRDTAMEWDLGERMFFQVGEPSRFRFKDGYFDLVISDGVLNQWADPVAVLGEIGRITKPTGAILIRDFLRPNRLQIASHIRKHGAQYPESIRYAHARSVRAGFTPEEFLELSQALGVEGTRVLADTTHVVIERRGIDDPESWVVERERYL